jgi:hypothetical protein
MFDTVDSEFWGRLFAEQPEVLHRLLADVHKVTADNAAALPGLEGLMAMFQPRFSTAPFPEAVRELLGNHSMRWLASKMKAHHSEVRRIIDEVAGVGKAKRTPAEKMARIERVAQALGVHPAYFEEWRRLWVLGVLDEVMSTDPRVSVSFWSRFGQRKAG